MDHNIYRRTSYKKLSTMVETATVKFVEQNKKKNITLHQEYLYLVDVKTVININALEECHKTKSWILNIMRNTTDLQKLIKNLEESMDLDRHRMVRLL